MAEDILLFKLKSLLRHHEGLRLRPYTDTVGKTSIGYGRNLDDVGISKEEAESLLDSDARKALDNCRKAFPEWDTWPDSVRLVLGDMCFNMGIGGLLKFEKMIALLHAGQIAAAAVELLDSKFAEQTKSRALELSQILKVGD